MGSDQYFPKHHIHPLTLLAVRGVKSDADEEHHDGEKEDAG